MNTDFSAERLAFILKEQKQDERIKELESLVSAQGIAAMDDADGLAQQEARIKELEADAARYRWLRDNKAQNNTHCWHFQNGPIIPGLLTLDTAIDAALKAASILDSSFPHSLDKASALGGGNVSEGIRKALSGS